MDIKNKLNEKQYLACSSTSKYLRIIAGAGTGKTRTLTYRIAYFISLGMPANRVLAITFTRKAADEMQERVKALLDENNISSETRPYINNFHGFCYRFLKKEITHLGIYDRNFQIIDEDDRSSILKEIFKTTTKGDSKDFTSAIMSKISNLKNDGVKAEQVTNDDVYIAAPYTFDELIYVYNSYEKYLRRQNLLDFDDLLLYTLEILEKFPEVRNYYSNKYDIIFVDEFQDTNLVQYNLLKYLIGPKTCLTVVGDPDQTIYTWRGAKNDIIKDRLQYDFKPLDTIVLDDNYRSTQSILDLSNMLIKNNTDRLEKDLHAANNNEGVKPVYKYFTNADEEGVYIARTIYNLVSRRLYEYKDIAVLYRATSVSRAIESQLPRYQIPYKVYGGKKFYERAEIKDLLAYFRILFTHDDLSMKRILKFPSRGIGDTTVENAIEFAKTLSDEENNLYTVFTKYVDRIKLTSKAKDNLNSLMNTIKKYEKLFKTYDDDYSELQTIIKSYLDEVSFLAEIKLLDKKNDEKLSYTDRTSTSKMDNVNELLSLINSYMQSDEYDEDGKRIHPTFSNFLIELTIQSSQDQIKDDNSITLMTSHVSKGLEFKVVFIAGLSDEIFPSHFAITGTKSQMEEERRLLYVSITRAQEQLYLTARGGHSYSGFEYRPSRFLKEIGFNNNVAEDNPLKKYANNNPYISKYNNPYSQKSVSSQISKTSSYPFNKPKVTVGSNRPNYNPNDALANQNYQTLDEVIHQTFGEGKVINVEPRNGGVLLTIMFNEIDGEKNVVKKIVPNKFSLKHK